jgi:hypothetical protein
MLSLQKASNSTNIRKEKKEGKKSFCKFNTNVFRLLQNSLRLWCTFAILALASVGIFTPNASAQASTGPAATTPESVLTWTASTTAGVTYTVYRATTAAGPFTAVASNINVLTYTDTSVTVGTTYYYEVDAVLGSAYSGPSNVVNGTIPANPNPPTGLSVVAQ